MPRPLLPSVLLVAVAMSALAAPLAASNRKDREAAISEIPLAALTPVARGRVWEIVSKPSLYRRLTPQMTECHPDMYLFLVNYPEVVVNMWEVMGATSVKLRRTGPTTYEASDGAGTDCDVELVYGSRDTHVLIAEGDYEGPLFSRPVKGRCVLLLKSAFVNEGGRQYVTNRMDVFLQVDHLGVELLAKTLHPLVGRAADTNFQQSTRFMGQVSQAARTNGPGLQRLAARLGNVEPAVRQQFAHLSARLHSEARRAQQSAEALALAAEAARDPEQRELPGERNPEPLGAAPVVRGQDLALNGATGEAGDAEQFGAFPGDDPSTLPVGAPALEDNLSGAGISSSTPAAAPAGAERLLAPGGRFQLMLRR